MRQALLPVLVAATVAVVAAASGPAQARSHPRNDRHIGCDVDSDYSVRPYRRAFLFTREGEPREVGIGGGRLFVDGREVAVSAADRARLAGMESEMRALVPEMRHVATEAVDIAFDALTEVARGLSGDPGQTVARLEASHRQMRARMTRSDLALLNEDAMGDVVRPILREYLPEIVGGAVRTAIRAAFSTGKEAGELKGRMDRMEHALDERVDARAKSLEPLAEAMCARLRRIDAFDDALEVRTADGRPYDLLDARPRDRDRDRPARDAE